MNSEHIAKTKLVKEEIIQKINEKISTLSGVKSLSRFDKKTGIHCFTLYSKEKNLNFFIEIDDNCLCKYYSFKDGEDSCYFNVGDVDLIISKIDLYF